MDFERVKSWNYMVVMLCAAFSISLVAGLVIVGMILHDVVYSLGLYFAALIIVLLIGVFPFIWIIVRVELELDYEQGVE